MRSKYLTSNNILSKTALGSHSSTMAVSEVILFNTYSISEGVVYLRIFKEL